MILLLKKSEPYLTYQNLKQDSFNLNQVWTIYIDDQETLWIGTGGAGLKGVNLKTKKRNTL